MTASDSEWAPGMANDGVVGPRGAAAAGPANQGFVRAEVEDALAQMAGSGLVVVRSLLETDLYKFTMWQALLHSQPAAHAEYRFVCRNKPLFPLAWLSDAVAAQLDHLVALRFTEAELDYLRSLRFLKSDFIDYLALFHFQRRFIEVGSDADQLTVVARGPLVHVTGYEIFVLYIVNELYFRVLELVQQQRNAPGAWQDPRREARRRLQAKIDAIRSYEADRAAADRQRAADAPFIVVDFGVRRRYARDWQQEMLQTLQQALPETIRGTSNVYLAWQLGLTPIGTMAHEYLQSYQAFGYRLRDFQKAALEGWVQEFRGDLGIALTDVVSMDAFLADFDLYFAKLFDGLRHDSGDPVAWGEKAIAHYQRLRIDPRTKRFVFSDGLSVQQAIDLHRHFAGRVGLSFGIGTQLTNDTGVPPLNIVMKLTSCNGQPVAKLSDAPGKTLCSDEVFLSYLRQVFQVPQPSS